MRRIIFLMAVSLIVIGFSLMAAKGKLSAQPQQKDGNSCMVPKAWGTYKGSSIQTGSLVFEDAAGTLRFVNEGSCRRGQKLVIDFEIHRQ